MVFSIQTFLRINRKQVKNFVLFMLRFHDADSKEKSHLSCLCPTLYAEWKQSHRTGSHNFPKLKHKSKQTIWIVVSSLENQVFCLINKYSNSTVHSISASIYSCCLEKQDQLGTTYILLQCVWVKLICLHSCLTVHLLLMMCGWKCQCLATVIKQMLQSLKLTGG